MDGFGNASWLNYVFAAYGVTAVFLAGYAIFARSVSQRARKAWDDEGFSDKEQ